MKVFRALLAKSITTAFSAVLFLILATTLAGTIYAAECSLAVSYPTADGEQSEYLSAIEEGNTSGNLTIPFGSSVSYTLVGEGFPQDRCDDYFIEFTLHVPTIFQGDRNTSKPATCVNGSIVADVSEMFTIDDVETDNSRSDADRLDIKLRRKDSTIIDQDETLCTFSYGIERGDDFYQDNREAGVQCLYPQYGLCGGNQIQLCAGVLNASNQCVGTSNWAASFGGYDLYVTDSGSACTQCFSCADATNSCPIGCDGNENDPITYSPGCAEMIENGEEAVCGNGVLEAGEGPNTCPEDWGDNINLGGYDGDTIQQVDYKLCEQIPDGTKRTQCQNCQGGGAIWTAVGCIPYAPADAVAALVTIGLGVAGGAAMLMILAGGWTISTSAGDPKKVGDAQEMIQAAVIGLLFVVFSVVILEFVGFTILRIPGFGG